MTKVTFRAFGAADWRARTATRSAARSRAKPIGGIGKHILGDLPRLPGRRGVSVGAGPWHSRSHRLSGDPHL